MRRRFQSTSDSSRVSLNRVNAFVLPPSAEWDFVLGRIHESYPYRQERTTKITQHFYDTFDWALYRRGLFLLREEGILRLRKIDDWVTVAAATWHDRSYPRFWRDVENGPLRLKLEHFLGIRALLPIASLHVHARSLRILNDDEKTVLRMRVEEIRLAGRSAKDPPLRRILLQPFRGYDAEFGAFRNFMAGLGLESDSRDLLTVVLESEGRAPGDYSSKLDIQFQPDVSAGRAVEAVLRGLLLIIRRNEKGILSDIDTEFLHDFRVAVRKTRSALSQFRSIFPQETVDFWRQRFAELGSKTNRLRDLDVYLLKKQEYKSLLPDELRATLDSLFGRLEAERAREHRTCSRFLRSVPYRDLIASWEEFLNRDGGKWEAGDGEKPIQAVARKRIYGRYKKVMRLGKRIEETSLDVQLHRLRIECKKLRYLMEFFASLHPEKETSDLINQFKKLQDFLGNYNDYAVQRRHLNEFLESIDQQDILGRKTSAAIGGIIVHLYQEQRRLRGAFSETFGAFASQENASLFHRLFGSTV